MSQQDTRVVYCFKNREHHNDSEQGSLTPIIEETHDGLVKADPQVYLYTGNIHVTRGYRNNFSALPDNTIFRVEATVSRAWNEQDNHQGMSKYVTFDRVSAPAKALVISLIIDADYPDPKTQGGMKCSSPFLPVDLFFIRCINSDDQPVIIGPLSVISGSQKDESGNYIFHYMAPSRPFGGEWNKVNEASHATMEFELDLISKGSLILTNDQEFLVNLEQLPFLSAKLVDLSSNENIIKWAAKLLRQSGSESKTALSVVKKIIEEIPNDIDLPTDIYESRRSRLKDIQSSLSEIDGFSQILADYMKSEDGQLVIKQHVETNRDSLLEKYSGEAIENIMSLAQDQADKDLSEVKKSIAVMKVDEENLKETIMELRSSEAGFQKENLQSEIKSLRDEKNIVLKVDELKIQKKITEEEIQILNGDRDKASALLSEIRAGISKTEESHKLKLIELKMGLEAISGNVKPESDIKANISVESEFKKILCTDLSEAKHEVISCIADALQNRGRIIDFNEVAVMLTCITQNLMVTLAGQPGSGKSSAVTELSSVLGLQDRNRYVRIQVQRGWTSDRDLLGFYNKLSHYYDPDRFGLYKLINGLQEIPSHSQFSLALLDEANLSPIEHYWSGFMGACDDPASFSTQGAEMKLPDGLRFISTVNYDRTTEPLSSRFIDRSPVIYLENKRINVITAPKASNETLSEDTCNYSFDELLKLFGRNPDAQFTSDENRIIEQILEDHQFISIKHRKINSVRQFTSVLRGVLSSGSSEKLNAFDYAILAHVLPMISGQGRHYAKYINDFHEFLQQQGLQYSAERTKHIIDRNQYDTYSYFS